MCFVLTVSSILSIFRKDFEQVAPFVPMIEDFVTSEQLDSREKYGYVLLILLIFYISLSFGAKVSFEMIANFSILFLFTYLDMLLIVYLEGPSCFLKVQPNDIKKL